MRRMGSPEPEEPPVPPEAAPALTPEADITGSFDGSWGARCLGVASGGRAGAFGVAGLAGDVARQAASTASVEAGAYRRTGAVGAANNVAATAAMATRMSAGTTLDLSKRLQSRSGVS